MHLLARADQRDSADNPLPPQTLLADYGPAALRDAGNSAKQYVPFWAHMAPPSVEAFSVAEDLKINLSPFLKNLPSTIHWGCVLGLLVCVRNYHRSPRPAPLHFLLSVQAFSR
jgi:hypothetical protein